MFINCKKEEETNTQQHRGMHYTQMEATIMFPLPTAVKDNSYRLAVRLQTKYESRRSTTVHDHHKRPLKCKHNVKSLWHGSSVISDQN